MVTPSAAQHRLCSGEDEAMKLGGVGHGAGFEPGLQLVSCTPEARCQDAF